MADSMDAQRKHNLLEKLVAGLCDERNLPLPTCEDDTELWNLFRALVNTRPPLPADDEWLAAQDELLQGIIAQAGVHTLADAKPSTRYPQLYLWRGDITTLALDAIVNAANSQMLGCWIPGHHCIDNAIHTFAGVQLRIECDRIMQAQGHEEPTGQAKITPAFNLPSRYVLHTVGPIVNGSLTQEHCDQLASSYRSCLELAAEHGLRSVAFCGISTGVFGFPQERAAEIAVDTVRGWLEETGSALDVMFNVFSAKSEDIYRPLLGLKGE